MATELDDYEVTLMSVMQAGSPEDAIAQMRDAIRQHTPGDLAGMAMNARRVDVAELVHRVMLREDAAEALEYVLSVDIGGPSCGCGADHWACTFGEEEEDGNELIAGVVYGPDGYEAEPADCDACGAEPGEACRPMCIGQAAALDAAGVDLTADGGYPVPDCPSWPRCASAHANDPEYARAVAAVREGGA